MIDKKKIREILDERLIAYEWFEHMPVYTVKEADDLDIPYAEYGLKNLFLKDKKKQYYLVSLHGSKKIEMKRLAKALETSNLHFASEEQLLQQMGLEKGHVTPFGVLNSEKGSVTAVFDIELKHATIGIHPMRNDATVFLKFEDLLAILTEYGYEAVFLDFTSI